jgi:hypothetical protein
VPSEYFLWKIVSVSFELMFAKLINYGFTSEVRKMAGKMLPEKRKMAGKMRPASGKMTRNNWAGFLFCESSILELRELKIDV